MTRNYFSIDRENGEDFRDGLKIGQRLAKTSDSTDYDIGSQETLRKIKERKCHKRGKEIARRKRMSER